MHHQPAFLDDMGRLAVEAGRAILEIYRTGFSVEHKEDNSPLTLADTRSHRIIADGLQDAHPDIPVLSEEGSSIPYGVRKDWDRYWLVDPLDGTKEFINRNDDFTVNIALICHQMPTMGVVYVPALDDLYLADVQKGCFRSFRGCKTKLKIPSKIPALALRIVQSRSHPSAVLDAYIQRFPSAVSIRRGSSLKFCTIASGEADLYPRLGPTWEWDTAAGHAVVLAAGGVVVDLEGNPVSYNKETLLNGPFLAAPSREFLQRIHAI
ncbi:MAG: 3'(2'),5'-bisphosphate nucleotidase CysQ [Pseudomonadota bacterium]